MSTLAMPSHEVKTKVRELIADHLAVDLSRVVPQARLVEDLGADDLDLIELEISLHEELEVEVEDGEIRGLSTAGDLISALQSRVAEK